jgi:hypothetical protein
MDKVQKYNSFNDSTSYIDLREVYCEDGWWIDLAQDRIHRRSFVVAVLKLWILLTDSYQLTFRIKNILRDLRFSGL